MKINYARIRSCRKRTRKNSWVINYRFYSQYPKIGFVTDIEKTNIEYKYINDNTNLEQDKSSTLNVDNKILDIIPNSMSQITIPNNNYNLKKNNNIIDLSKLPSWYERLQNPSTYNIINDIIKCSKPTPFRSFQRCYVKLLTSYADRFISLTKPQMKELQLKLENQDLPNHLQQEQIKLDLVSKRLSDLSANTYIMYKRLKINRLTSPFYLHQQFLIHLGANNLSKLLDLYFELPEPRPLYLKREEFEKLMSLLLRLKISNDDHKSLLPKIIDVYDDIRKNGNGINLTPFEETKYLSFLLNLWTEENLSQEEKYIKIINLKSNSTKKLNFCPAMWNILLTHFPEKNNEIIKMMSEESGISRTNIEIYLKHSKSFNEFCNLLELMKLKFFHIDPYLLDTIILKLIEFNKTNDALSLIFQIIKKFHKISNLNWIFLTKKDQRFHLFKLDVLNKTLQQLNNEFSNKPFTWLRYKFKPNPFTIGKLLTCLNSNDDKSKLLILMTEQNIPLANKFAIELLKDCNFDTIPLILTLVNSSFQFNDDLHKFSTDARFDTNYLKNFIYDSSDSIFELKEIFKISLKLYDENEKLENSDNTRISIAGQLVSLNNKLKNE